MSYPIQPHLTNETSEGKLVLVLVNRHSGQGRSLKVYQQHVKPFLDSRNVEHEVFITGPEQWVKAFLLEQNSTRLAKFKTILVVAGDGLMHEVVNALMSRPDWEEMMNIPLGIVPTGSGNGLAATLLNQFDIPKRTMSEVIQYCCEQAVQDQTSQSDLVRVTYGNNFKLWSFLSIGWGLLSDIDLDSEWLRFFGEFRFTIYGILRALTSRSYKGKLSYNNHINSDNSSHSNHGSTTSDSVQPNKQANYLKPNDDNLNVEQSNQEGWTHIVGDFTCLYAVNQSHISSVTNFAPLSNLTDQLIYLTYITDKLNPYQIIKYLISLKDGSYGKLPYVTVVPVSSFRFQPLETSRVVVDGELISWNVNDGPIDVAVVPKMMKLSWAPGDK